MLTLSADINEPLYIGDDALVVFGVSGADVVYCSVGGVSQSIGMGEWVSFRAGRFRVKHSTTRYGGVSVCFDYPRSVRIGRKVAA